MSVDDRSRRSIVRDALAIGVATGAYGLSFGALSTAAGLSILQTSALSLLMFTGASQFAMVSVIGGGGSPIAAAATAVLLSTRNAFYGLRLSSMIGRRGPRTVLAAQFVIDETTAMAVAASAPTQAPAPGRPLAPGPPTAPGPPPQAAGELVPIPPIAPLRGSDEAGRLAFWATAVSVFSLWNLGTLVGALGAQAIPDPRTLGLDAAAPAAFVALLAPRMRGRLTWSVSTAAAVVAILTVPFVPAGVPILLAALVTVGIGLSLERRAVA